MTYKPPPPSNSRPPPPAQLESSSRQLSYDSERGGLQFFDRSPTTCRLMAAYALAEFWRVRAHRAKFVAILAAGWAVAASVTLASVLKW